MFRKTPFICGFILIVLQVTRGEIDKLTYGINSKCIRKATHGISPGIRTVGIVCTGTAGDFVAVGCQQGTYVECGGDFVMVIGRCIVAAVQSAIGGIVAGDGERAIALKLQVLK